MNSQDVLTDVVLQRLYRHAEARYPGECCGLIFTKATVHLGTNIQDQLNQRQPEIYRRTAANGYTFSVADTVLLNQSLKGSNPVAVIYHSHPDVGAYFSREDEDKALFMGQPIFPVAYLVIDVRNARALGASLFEWGDGEFTTPSQRRQVAVRCRDPPGGLHRMALRARSWLWNRDRGNLRNRQ